jgi:hypothetical protein
VALSSSLTPSSSARTGDANVLRAGAQFALGLAGVGLLL